MHLSQAPFCPTGSLYTLGAGDTLSAIAARFNTTVEAIISANPGIEPRNLQIGRIICVPGPRGACPGGFPYQIQPGDTFYALARRFSLSTAALLAANPQVDPGRLQIGQVICLPQQAVPPRTALCCVTLGLVAEIPTSQLFPGGVALLKPAATATDATSITFAAAGLPSPSVFGQFDAYLGQVVIPSAAPNEPPEVFAVILRSILNDNLISWAGTRAIPREVPGTARIEIMAVNTAVGRGGVVILRNLGKVCS